MMKGEKFCYQHHEPERTSDERSCGQSAEDEGAQVARKGCCGRCMRVEGGEDAGRRVGGGCDEA